MKMMIRGLIVSMLVLVLFVSPALASQRLTLKTLGAETSAGQGSSAELGNRKYVSVTVRVTAGVATVTVFRVWIEGTVDGTNWFELPCGLVLKTGAAAPGTAASQRDIVNETSVQTSAAYIGQCELSVTTIRAAWNITGTTPSETFEVLAIAK